MCYYITTTLPKDTNMERIKSLLEDFNMSLTSKKFCDCDTV